MALNGAEHVHAIDIQREAVANTLANAFRNGVSDHVSGADVDLYSFMPEEKYDVIVASLYQMPVDPMGEITGHRAVDFWGRNLLDHLIWMLPNTLADGGTAYIMQVSILSQLQTAQKLEEAGLSCKVIDFAFFHFSPIFYENMAQIEHVEQISDAYHLKFSGADVMVMYLLEVKRIQ
jgi:23S rRNA G2069 N7-methylase RlmK/C1962 C5-methylase RlmI